MQLTESLPHKAVLLKSQAQRGNVENLEDYIYPLKNNGKELDDKERCFFRSCKEYFDSFDKNTWNLKGLYYFMANKCSIKFTVTLLKEIYIRWLQQFLKQEKININFYISKSNEAKSTKLIHETDENINQWPWNFRNSSTTIMTPSIQNCLKEEILKDSFEELDQDNPLCSNILDISDPDSWNGEYKEEYDINEGTWMSHSVTIPFNIAARDIQKLRLLVSSDEIDKENKITKKARKGQKPDLKFISKETYKNQGKVNFELLVEVCSSPWEEKQPKTNIDYNNNGVNICGALVAGFRNENLYA
nr:1410_t:CDS:2 [Entrophospora candida]